MAKSVAAAPDHAVERLNGTNGHRARPVFQPRADIYETGDGIVVMAEMPGVAPGDIDVTLEGRVLTIRGRMPQVSHDGYRRIYAEYGEGDYECAFTVSELIDRDGIKATQKDGLLVLELPKQASAKARAIRVRAV